MGDHEERPLDPAELREADALERLLSARGNDEAQESEDARTIRIARGLAADVEHHAGARVARVTEAVLAEVAVAEAVRRPGRIWELSSWRASLRRSTLLRVLAASLLLHLLTLPAIAWWWWRPEPEPSYVLRFEPDGAPAVGAAGEDRTGPAPAQPNDAQPHDVESARRVDRYRLARAERPSPPDGADPDRPRTSADWFARRVAGPLGSRPIEPGELAHAPVGPAAESAALEVAFDRLTAHPDDQRALELALRRLSALRGLAADDDGLRPLVLRAEARARRVGLESDATTLTDLDPTPQGWLATVEPFLREDPLWGAWLEVWDGLELREGLEATETDADARR